MHPSQQHSSPHVYYNQDPNASPVQSYNAVPTSPHAQMSRSSSISGTPGYQPVASSQYFMTDMHQQQHYAQQQAYSQEIPHHYPSNTNTHPPSAPSFLGSNRSTSDGVTYTMRQHDTGSPTDYRRSSIPSQAGGPIRSRTVSLSYPRNSDATYDPYGRQQYQQDPRYSSSSQMYPPTSYRGGMASSPLQQSISEAPSSRPIPSTLDTSITYPTEYLARRASVSSHSPTHLRGEVPVTSTSQIYQQPGNSSPSSSGSQPRPHVCEVCGVGFARGHDLKRHKDTHSNSKPHVCECGKSFSRKDALKRHVFLKSCRGEKHASGYATADE